MFPLPTGNPPVIGELGLPEEFLLLHPFARGEGKSLTVEQIRAFCANVAPTRVVLVGRCADALRGIWPENTVDLFNSTSLPQLIWVIRRAKGVVTVDSGPAHLAAALGRPMIAIHTWSDPRRVGPYRDDAWVWKNGQLLQFKQLLAVEDSFFQQASLWPGARDLAAIAELATSF